MVGSTAFGVPGVLDDFDFWQRTVGNMSAGWQGVLIGGGGAVLAISTLVFIEHRWTSIRAHADVLAILAMVVLALCLLGGVGYGIWYGVSSIDFSRPEKAWVHPDNHDPTTAVGDCEMRAYDAIGGKPLGGGARLDYVQSCMVSKGFELKIVDGD